MKQSRLIDVTFKQSRLIDKNFSDFIIKVKQMTLLQCMFVLFVIFFIFSTNFFIFMLREELERIIDIYFVTEADIKMVLEMTKKQDAMVKDLNYVLESSSKSQTYSLNMFRIFVQEPTR